MSRVNRKAETIPKTGQSLTQNALCKGYETRVLKYLQLLLVMWRETERPLKDLALQRAHHLLGIRNRVRAVDQ